MKGNIVGNIDVAQVALYVFFGFFAGLVFYLHRESKREGYPLQSVSQPGKWMKGLFGMPAPKTYILPHGGTQVSPRAEADERELKAKPVASWPGAPLMPTGNPMVDGVGAAAWAERSDKPDLTLHGAPRIVPMQSAPGYSIEQRDPDPRGMDVIGADGNAAGVVRDVWVDRSEALIRYLEIDVAPALAAGGRRVLLPMTLAKVSPSGLLIGPQRRVEVKSITAKQFAQVPVTASPNQVTRREEDQICAYYAGGHLYAMPSRQEPWL